MIQTSIKQQLHQVSEDSFVNCLSLNTFVSQPVKYLLVFITFQFSMAVYFAVTRPHSSPLEISLTAICYVLVTVCMMAFPFIDPGVIPKILFKNIPLNITYLKDCVRSGFYIDREYCSPIKGHSMGVRLCNECFIYRPPRGVHCYCCNVCIQKLDHHCPWLGMCIGKRNYRLYLFFIFAMEAILILLYIQTIHYVMVVSFQMEPVGFVLDIILIAMIILPSVFVLLLIVFHLKLSSHNETTNQFCHQKWDIASGNPFKKPSSLKNCLKTCFSVHKAKHDPVETVFKRRNTDFNLSDEIYGSDKNIANQKREMNIYPGQIVLKTNKRYLQNE